MARTTSQMEEMMRKAVVTVTAMTAILGAGWLMSTAQAAPTASRSAVDNAVEAVNYRRAHRHVVRQSNNEITSFSSSSVGVNHPPKK
jgi:hypothetical protein